MGQMIVSNPLEIVQLDPLIVPTTEGILLDGSASLTSGSVYQVIWEVVNVSDDSAKINIGIDIAAGGGLVTFEFFLNTYLLPAGGTTGPRTITIGADDDMRGISDKSNTAAIHFIEVKRVI